MQVSLGEALTLQLHLVKPSKEDAAAIYTPRIPGRAKDEALSMYTKRYTTKHTTKYTTAGHSNI